MTLERTYVIPLRAGFVKTQKYRRTNRAVAILREFLVRHMKVSAENVKLGQHLNRLMWVHGIKNPPAKVTVKVTKSDDGIVYAELADKEYLGTVKPLAKTEEAQGLKGKIESALGAKKSDAAEEKDETKAEKKAKPDVRKTPLPKVPKQGVNAGEEH